MRDVGSRANAPGQVAGGALARLIDGFDGIVCDLDGVVYRGQQAVPHAVESLLVALSGGVRIVYATNNASRPPADVATHLGGLGLPGPDTRVVTSAQAAAHLVAQRFPAGSEVMAVGGPGVALALERAGLRAILPRQSGPGEHVVAVVQGYGSGVGWKDLAEVAYAVQGGAYWVATNDDATLPTERGLAPGNGALVAAVRAAVDVVPVVVGKPNTPLYELSISALGTDPERTLAIGDRLDTDIAGATSAGLSSLFVLGGVHGWRDVAGAAQAARPRYVATDLRSLHTSYVDAMPSRADPERWTCGETSATVSADGELVMARGGGINERLRAALGAIWHARDVRGSRTDLLSGDVDALSRELDQAMHQGH